MGLAGDELARLDAEALAAARRAEEEALTKRDALGRMYSAGTGIDTTEVEARNGQFDGGEDSLHMGIGLYSREKLQATGTYRDFVAARDAATAAYSRLRTASTNPYEDAARAQNKDARSFRMRDVSGNETLASLDRRRAKVDERERFRQQHEPAERRRVEQAERARLAAERRNQALQAYLAKNRRPLDNPNVGGTGQGDDRVVSLDEAEAEFQRTGDHDAYRRNKQALEDRYRRNKQALEDRQTAELTRRFDETYRDPLDNEEEG
ncbi:MAG: hypothetical protein SFW67_35545 [Myxococcaceae bacterium]|nr:hypothetical protein [Myxococcaceae bacterium]